MAGGLIETAQRSNCSGDAQIEILTQEFLAQTVLTALGKNMGGLFIFAASPTLYKVMVS